MRKVFLHGELGNSLGSEWDLEVDSVQEALQAIEANTNKLNNFLRKNAERITHYTFALDGKKLDKHQLRSSIKDDEKDIHIMPQIAGGDPINILIFIVVSIVTSLIMQAIFKPPKAKEQETTNSYLFSGTQNVAAQGVPVPIGYGRMRVGSVVVSAAVRHVEVAPTSAQKDIIEWFTATAKFGKAKFWSKMLDRDVEIDVPRYSGFNLDPLTGGLEIVGYLIIDPLTNEWQFEIDHVVQGGDLDNPNGWRGLDDGDRTWPKEPWCWVAREVYGANNSKWLLFRHWLLNYSPNWFCNWYKQNGKKAAKWLSKNSWLKPAIRRWMNGRIQSLGKNIK